MRIIWQGGSSTELVMALTKTGGHFRATDEDTVDLVRRLAVHYDDTTIALILARQHRRTGTGLPFTKSRVKSLRTSRGIPAHQPPETVTADGDDAVVVTVAEAERLLGVGKVTIYRWLRDGFLTGEQLTPARRGGSGSTKPSATASCPTSPTAGSASTKPPRSSAWPAKRCCIRSNAANSRPSTSTADAAKA